MPFVPPVAFPQKTSVFTDVIDHRRYVAIASNFLHAMPKFRFDINKAELKVLLLLLFAFGFVFCHFYFRLVLCFAIFVCGRSRGLVDYKKKKL